jgi:hypothetical protein
MNESPYRSAPRKVQPKKKPTVKVEKIYVATASTRYKFLCDGTTCLLQVGVSPTGLTEAQTRELKKFNRIEEVK